MATSSDEVGIDNKKDERRNQLMLGELPTDFLRVTSSSEDQQLAADEQAALALQQQLSGGSFVPSNVTGRLSINLIEARLTKNYGMTRMDPYVRLRIGQTVYETHTDYNGAKNPKWNKIFHCFIMPGVNTVYLEIFDECAFTLDEKIAWAHYTIPDTVFAGEPLDESIPLNGRQGDEKEGFINLVFTYATIPAGTLVYPQPMVVVTAPYCSVVPGVVPYYAPVPATAQHPVHPQPAVQQGAAHPQQQHPAVQPVQITEDDIKQVEEMFPNMDREVIKTVMESHMGNKENTINALLSMSSES